MPPAGERKAAWECDCYKLYYCSYDAVFDMLGFTRRASINLIITRTSIDECGECIYFYIF